MIFLCEICCLKKEMERVRGQVGFQNAFTVDYDIHRNQDGRVSRAGGLCLLWRDGVEVSLCSYSKNHIDVSVGGLGEDSWRFTGVYSFSKVEDRHLTWELIRRLGRHNIKPRLLGGDLNEILRSSEKEGGPLRCHRQMAAFKDCINASGLIDLNFAGPIFTWKGKRSSRRIDQSSTRSFSSHARVEKFVPGVSSNSFEALYF
ncbi:hypothetical protein ACLB2K_069457 [Fragaria x ananassa]